jgi:phosphoribosylanthranilate isomerase
VTKIKICGITDVDQALAAADCGVDYIGLVFASSRRQVSTQRAAQITEVLRTLPSHPDIVGVFVNLPALEVNTISRLCHLDLVQLSGNETYEYCRNIDLPVIKAIHISNITSISDIITTIKVGSNIMSGSSLTYLLDSQIRNEFGGTGQTFDWQIAKVIAMHYSVIIAGGLTPNNVERLISEVNPWGVDVSSGVETNGKKDILKIRNFINNVKSCNGG